MEDARVVDHSASRRRPSDGVPPPRPRGCRTRPPTREPTRNATSRGGAPRVDFISPATASDDRSGIKLNCARPAMQWPGLRIARVAAIGSPGGRSRRRFVPILLKPGAADYCLPPPLASALGGGRRAGPGRRDVAECAGAARRARLRRRPGAVRPPRRASRVVPRRRGERAIGSPSPPRLKAHISIGPKTAEHNTMQTPPIEVVCAVAFVNDDSAYSRLDLISARAARCAKTLKPALIHYNGAGTICRHAITGASAAGVTL